EPEATLEREAEPEAEAEHAVLASGMDTVLYEIFRAEVEGHLATLGRFLAVARAPAVVGDDALRALHTMNGSAAMAGAHAIAELIDPYEQLCKLFTEQSRRLEAIDLSLLQEMIEIIPRQLDYLRDGG